MSVARPQASRDVEGFKGIEQALQGTQNLSEVKGF